MSYGGSRYGGGYSGGYGMLPALSIKTPGLDTLSEGAETLDRLQQAQSNMQLAPLELAAKKQELQQQQSLLPLQGQEATGRLNLGIADNQNSQIANVARRAAAADPADAPGVWDSGMKSLAANGVDAATQYVGHYRPELGERVLDAFGGQSDSRSRAAAGQPAGPDPAILQQKLTQIPKPQLMSMVRNQNMVINAFNGIKTADDLTAAVQNLKQSGVDVTPFMQGIDLNDKSPLGFARNYATIHQAVQTLTPYRDAAQTVLAVQGTGGVVVPPTSKGSYMVAGYDAQGQPIMVNRNNPNAPPITIQGAGIKPSAGTQTFLAKQQGWLALHPDDQDGALQYANGQKKLQPSEVMNMALTRANQQMGDAVLAGEVIPDPDKWQRDKAKENYQLLTGSPSGSGTPGSAAKPSAPASPPGGRGPSHLSPQDIQASIANARAAIGRGANRAVVLQRLQAAGVPIQGL